MNSISVAMPATTRSGLSRMLKYVLVRATTLLLTVVAAVYLTILIANFGGQIDDFIKADIDFAVGLSMRDMRGITTEERATIAEERRQAGYAAAGLNTPFVVRCFRWLWRGLTLDWGESNMILPFLPVSILVYVLYSKSFWTILGVTVLLSIFGTSIKNYRALFLQIRESSYIEAALAYGAGDGRIIFRYLIPRIASVLIPHLVILVPSYVFLESSLAFLGVSDPVLPTWGKLIAEGLTRNIYAEKHHLILQPLGLLMLLSFAFVMLGISLERRTKTRLGLR